MSTFTLYTKNLQTNFDGKEILTVYNPSTSTHKIKIYKAWLSSATYTNLVINILHVFDMNLISGFNSGDPLNRPMAHKTNEEFPEDIQICTNTVSTVTSIVKRIIASLDWPVIGANNGNNYSCFGPYWTGFIDTPRDASAEPLTLNPGQGLTFIHRPTNTVMTNSTVDLFFELTLEDV